MQQLDLSKNPSFIETFVYLYGQSEIPKLYLQWGAMGAIAALLGRNVHMQFGFYTTYPCLYLFFFGPSGIGKNQVINEVKKLCMITETETFRGRLTSAGLKDKLQDTQNGGYRSKPVTIFIPEMSQGIKSKDEAKAIFKDLTDYFDNETTEEWTRAYGYRQVIEPCINIMMGSTLDWAGDVMEKQDLTEGWGARIWPLIAHYDFKKRVFEPGNTITNREKIIDYLHAKAWQITQIHGEMKFSSESYKFLKNLYETMPEPQDDKFSGLWKRKPIWWQKLSTILYINQYMSTGFIELPLVKKAIKLAEHQLNAMPVLYSNLGANKSLEYIQEIFKFIEKKGEVSHKQILQRFSRDLHSPEVKTAEAELLAQGRIETVGAKSNIFRKVE